MIEEKQKLNILMPSYNKESYIKTAIESVMNQETNFDFTLIITDDGSNDKTIEIIKDCQNKYGKKIILLPSKKNQGLLANIIKAYKYMNCEYFVCLDADDYLIDKNFYQKAIDFLDKHTNYNIYASNTYALFENGIKHENVQLNKRHIDSEFKNIFDETAILGNTISSVFRNNIIDDKMIKFLQGNVGDNYIEHSYREDDFRNRVHLAKGKAHFVNDFVGVYRCTNVGIFQGSNQLKKANMKCQSYIDMYSFFGKENIEWIYLAIRRLHNIKEQILHNDWDNLKQFPNKDIIQLFKIVSEISKHCPEFLDKELDYFKQNDKICISNLKHKFYYAVYSKLRKKLKRKNII